MREIAARLVDLVLSSASSGSVKPAPAHQGGARRFFLHSPDVTHAKFQ